MLTAESPTPLAALPMELSDTMHHVHQLHGVHLEVGRHALSPWCAANLRDEPSHRDSLSKTRLESLPPQSPPNRASLGKTRLEVFFRGGREKLHLSSPHRIRGQIAREPQNHFCYILYAGNCRGLCTS